MFTPQDEIEIKKRLADVTNPVKLILFTQSLNCETCPETERLLRALVEFSSNLSLEVNNPHVDREKTEQYKVERVPTLVLEGDQDYGIRFLGMPGGYEFASLMEDLIAIGKRNSGLSDASREKLKTITEPLNLKVFVTPG